MQHLSKVTFSGIIFSIVADIQRASHGSCFWPGIFKYRYVKIFKMCIYVHLNHSLSFHILSFISADVFN